MSYFEAATIYCPHLLWGVGIPGRQIKSNTARSNAAVIKAIPVAPVDASKLTMAERVERFDWASTPLGPMDQWPASLRTAVGLCLASPVPSLVWWGPDLINIYNDAHAPQLTDKHPAALGQPAAKVWAAIWPQMKDLVDAVMLRGESVVRERYRVVMKREGFPDEMYFTFTNSPILDDSGKVGGMFHIALDETARVTAETESRAAHARAQEELKLANAEAEIRLTHWHSIIANMAEGVILADMKGNLLDCNRAALKMMGSAEAVGIHRNIAELRTDLEVYDLHGAVIPFKEWCLCRLLHGEAVRNVEVRVHRFELQPDLVLVCNGTLIRDERGEPHLALLSMHDATDRHRGGGASPARAEKSLEQHPEYSAEAAASAAESLLHKMHLTPNEREFCASLGQHLVQNAIDTYLMTNQHTKMYDGSCIAASLAVAMIIVHDM